MSTSGKTGCSRRQFCAAAGATLLIAGVGCDANPSPLDDGGAGGDLGSSGGADLAQKSSGSCGGPLNAGPASAISSPKLVSGGGNDVFVCRDSGGLYALTAVCPHQGCTVRAQSTEFFCPCHGATFDLNGQKPTSPARSPLDHYALCVDANGTVWVDYNTTVSPSTRA